MPKRPRDRASRRYRFRIGYEGEYYLVKKFIQRGKPGYYAVRTPGSGTGKMIKPDLLAVDGGELYAIEVKTTMGREVYVPEEQVKRLRAFAELFQVKCPSCGNVIKPKPVVAVRFLNRGWIFTEVDGSENSIVVRYHGEKKR